MNVGYSFWGFLGDMKFGPDGRLASTPDGNAFYSWSVIRELQLRGYEVVQMMPDRDSVGIDVLCGDILFQSWASEKRKSAYRNTKKAFPSSYFLNSTTKEEVFAEWDKFGLDKASLILHEWRMEIQGRNTDDVRHLAGWQPDLFFQECVIEYCKKNEVKLVIFDLDYKLDETAVKKMIDDGIDLTVLELGNKWKDKEWAKQVYIPFDFSSIYEFRPNAFPENKLVYVGNRYERDWCIDKYIPKYVPGVVVHGNWNEGGRDSEDRWPSIDFRRRLQTCEMHDVYSSSATTILLAKQDYCEYGFMTARIIEALFYGTVPLFISEYGESLIEKFAGKDNVWYITVKSEEDVVKKMNKLYDNYTLRLGIINSMRERLKKFMDVKFFVDELLSC